MLATVFIAIDVELSVYPLSLRARRVLRFVNTTLVVIVRLTLANHPPLYVQSIHSGRAWRATRHLIKVSILPSSEHQGRRGSIRACLILVVTLCPLWR